MFLVSFWASLKAAQLVLTGVKKRELMDWHSLLTLTLKAEGAICKEE